MKMAYQRKHICYRCGGKGFGAVEIFMSEYEKQYRSWTDKRPCLFCDGKGYNFYDFHPHDYDGNWVEIDWETVGVDSDIDIRLTCICGERLWASDDNVVCTCGRIYQTVVKYEVDETHLGDMEYWENYKNE